VDDLDATTVAVGVDVSVARGLDVVAIDGTGAIVGGGPWRRQAPADLERLLRDLEPAVVAIDSPPAWGTNGGSRPAERAVRALGMGIFATPSDPAMFDHPFYRWMVAGFAAFASAADAGYPHYRGAGPVAGRALEVYPHATALRLGGDPTLGSKRVWRRAVLESNGVDCRTLSSVDAIDAALAACTGLLALAGRCEALGDETDGVIVIPRTSVSCVRTATPT
jgi:predicted RNase H-like nuclease